MTKIWNKLVYLLTLVPVTVQAALSPDVDTECPEGIICDSGFNIKEYAMSLVNWLLGFVGIIAVVLFIYAGVLFLISAGNDESVGKAKKIMLYAVIGIVIIFLAYTIVNALTTGLEQIGA